MKLVFFELKSLEKLSSGDELLSNILSGVQYDRSVNVVHQQYDKKTIIGTFQPQLTSEFRS